MSIDPKSAQSVATFKEQLASSLDALEGMAARRTKQDEEKLEHFRKNAESIVERADAILAEIAAFQGEWGGVLDRIIALDVEKLRAFPGRNKLGNPVENAKQIRRALLEARQRLTGLKNRIGAVTAKDLPGFSLATVYPEVETLGQEVQRALDQLEIIQRDMSSFQEASRP